MTIIATALKHLIAAGVSGDDLVRAVAEMEAASKPARSSNAERQARYRERHAGRLKGSRPVDKEWLALTGQVIARDGACVYCGDTERLTADHMVPVSRGGHHTLSNLVACCEPCNKSKGPRLPQEWIAAGGRRDGVTVTLPPLHNANNAPPNEYISNPPEPQSAKADRTPFPDLVVETWNAAIVGTPLPKARMTNDRLKHLRARLKEHSQADVLQAIRNMAASEWHSGKSGQWTEGNLGWLLKSPENFTKMLERSPSSTPAEQIPDEEWNRRCDQRAESLRRFGKPDEAKDWERRKRGPPALRSVA